MAVERYRHHNADVAVVSEYKGRHRDICLCFHGCKFFKPGSEDHCEIASENYLMCVKYSLCAPVLECAKFSRDD